MARAAVEDAREFTEVNAKELPVAGLKEPFKTLTGGGRLQSIWQYASRYPLFNLACVTQYFSFMLNVVWNGCMFPFWLKLPKVA